MFRRFQVVVLVMVACLLCSAPAFASGYFGAKTGAGVGTIGLELELPVYQNFSVVLDAGLGSSGAISAFSAAFGVRGYLSYEGIQPFVTGYIGTVSASYFSWYTGPMDVNVTYGGATVGAKYEQDSWYATAEIGYGQVPAVAASGLMFGVSMGLKF